MPAYIATRSTALPEVPAAVPPAPATLSLSDRLAGLHPPASDPYRRLNPLTGLVIASAGVAAGLVGPSLIGPLAGILVIVNLAWIATARERVTRAGAIAGLAVGGVVTLVDVLTGHGAAVIAGGSLEAGLRGALVGMSMRLWTATVDLPALRLDLERRGLPHRAAVGLIGLLGAGPGLRERLAAIVAAQQARGYDPTGGRFGGFGARSPVWLPALVSTLDSLTERSLALESRAIGRPGRRALLWVPPDPVGERALRWAIGIAIGVTIVARLTGAIS